MKYTDYQTSAKSVRSLTGLSHDRFLTLLPCFEEAHDRYLTHYDMADHYRNNRSRFTIYENSLLPTVEDRLFFIPVYLKNNPTREYHAAGFNMDQKQCNSFIHVMYHIPEQCLRDADVMPAESQKEFEKLLNAQPVEEGHSILLHDGTEREIPRPVYRDEQRENYSGKKKKHTVRHAIIITACCLILFVSPAVCGKTHDKRIAGTQYSFPSPCLLYQDTGYQGYKPEGISIYQPIKKP